MLSSDPISPFIEGSGRDDEGRGSLIGSSADISSERRLCFDIPIELLTGVLIWLYETFFGMMLGVSLW